MAAYLVSPQTVLLVPVGPQMSDSTNTLQRLYACHVSLSTGIHLSVKTNLSLPSPPQFPPLPLALPHHHHHSHRPHPQ